MFQYDGREYDVIVVDPPWQYRNKGSNGAAEDHYRTLSLDELCRMRLPAGPTAFLLVWTTGPMLADTLEFIIRQGFTYKTVAFVWEKTTKAGVDSFGPGNYTRPSCEYLLLASRNVGTLSQYVHSHSVRQLLRAERREHSRKPDEAYTRIKELFKAQLRFCDLFARESREGWATYGDEAQKFDDQMQS